MAEAIGAAIVTAVASAEIASTAIIGTLTVAQVVGSTVLIGGSLLVNQLTTPDTKQKVAAQQFSSKQSLPPRRRAYGTVMIAGPKVEYKSLNGRFYNAIYHCEGPIGGFLGFWLEDKRATPLDNQLAGPAGIAPWNGSVVVEAHRGYPDQAASTLLQQLPQWKPTDRLAGCAYSLTMSIAPSEKQFPKVFPSGTWPEHRVLIRASLVRNLNDPAQSDDPATWGWTDNAALCIRDHLTHPQWGLKVPYALIDDASFAAMANLCAQVVMDKAGNSYPRYYLGGAFDLTDEPADVLQGMLDACDGRPYLTPEGKIGISGGVYVAPEVTLRDPHIISTGQIEVGSGKRATFNRLKISYVSPLHDYQVIEGDPWEDLDGQASAGEILEADFARQWVQNHNQLRRLAKIHTARKNPQYRITGLMTDRSGLPALFEDQIRLVLTRYGIDAVFTVERAIAAGDGSTCTFDFVSIDPAAFTFNAATEEGIAPAIPGVDAAPALPAPPVNPTVLVDRRVVSGDTSAVFVRLVSAPTERSDLSLIGRYRRVGDTAWIDMAQEGDNAFSVISSVLADGEAYEVQAAIATYGRSSQSDWTPAIGSPVTAIADATSTGPVTGFTATGGASQASYAFTTPNASNVGSVQVLRGTGADIATAASIRTANAGPSQPITGTDTGLDLAVYRYWVRALNRSGFTDAAALAGPVAAYVIHPAGNLFAGTDDFTNAAWAYALTSATANQAAGPDGVVSADLIADQVGNSTHSFAQIASGIVDNSLRRLTIALKANGRTSVMIRLSDGANEGAGGVDMNVDLAAATAGGPSAYGTAAIASDTGSGFSGSGGVLNLGSGWVLVSVRARISEATSLQGRIYLKDAGGSLVYAGDPTKGVYAIAGALS